MSATKLAKMLEDANSEMERILKKMNKDRIKDIKSLIKKLDKIFKQSKKSKLPSSITRQFKNDISFSINTLEGIIEGITNKVNVSTLKKHAKRVGTLFDNLVDSIDDILEEEQEEESPKKTKKLNKGLSMQDQLKLLKNDMLGKKRPKGDKYKENYYEDEDYSGPYNPLEEFNKKQEQAIKDLKKAKPRLLNKKEMYGYIKSTVVLVNYYINSKAMDSLEEDGYNFERVFGHYLQCKTMTMIGAHRDLVDEMGSDQDEAIEEITAFVNKKRGATDGVVGPIKSNGPHIYWLVFPKKYLNGPLEIDIDDWDFSGR